MKVRLALALALVSSSASATIYLVAADPATRSVGVLVLSSGPVITYPKSPLKGVKGVGFTGWSGSAANVSAKVDSRVMEMMRLQMPTEQIEAYVDSQIHQKYSRYIFISAVNGSIGHVFPPRGCAEPECGALDGGGHQFLVMGGGLNPDVVENTVKGYEAIHAAAMPLECKLLLGAQTIINVGGEKKEFAEAGIAVDHPGQQKHVFHTSVGNPEARIVAHLRAELAGRGIQCPAMLQLRPRVKPRRPPRSSDLD